MAIRKSNLLYPTLSDGVVVALCPSLHGPSGNTVPDMSGRGTNLTLNGPTWVRSHGKWALDFDGTNDEATFYGLRDISTTAPRFTWSSWFLNRGSWTNYGSLVNSGTDAATRSISIRFADAANYLHISLRQNGGGGGWVQSPITKSNNVWYHLAVTMSENGRVQTWINGRTFGVSSVTLGTAFASNPLIYLGRPISGAAPIGTPNWFNGLQDDIRIYNRNLSAGEIRALATERGAAYKEVPRSFVFLGATPSSDITRSAGDDFSLTQTATYTIDLSAVDRSVNQNMGLAQTVTYFKLTDVYDVYDDLGLTDSVKVQGYEYPADTIALIQGVDFRIGPPIGGYFLADTLLLTDTLVRSQSYGLNDNLGWMDTGANILPVVSTLALTQTIVQSKAKDVRQEVEFVQSTESESSFQRNPNHSLILQHAVGYYFVGGKCGKATYSRFEGFGEMAGLPDKPRQQPKSPVSFETVDGSIAPVFVRSPEMDDIHRLSFDRVNRETLGGDLSVFRDESWTSTTAMLFTIVGIKPAVFSSIQAFILATLGQEVLFNDWTGVTWRGVITNPDEAATEDRDGYWTLAFEFDGEPFEGPPANHSFNFTQTASFTVE